MASLSWEKKIAIFRAFRRLGKVYPTAIEQHVARATVSRAIEEFEAEGFERSSRITGIGSELMGNLQLRHIMEVLHACQRVSPDAPLEPDSSLYENQVILEDQPEPVESRSLPQHSLEMTRMVPSDDGIQFTAQSAGRSEVALGSMVQWHLKGTTAEDVLSSTFRALEAYDQQCVSMWNRIKELIEGLVGLSVRQAPQSIAGYQGPGLVLSHSVGKICSAAFTQSPLRWSPSNFSIDPAGEQFGGFTLQYQGSDMVAWGSREDMDRCRSLFTRFEEDGRLTPLMKEVTHIQRLTADLRLLVDHTREVMSQTTLGQLAATVCPWCPFPETDSHLESVNADTDTPSDN